MPSLAEVVMNSLTEANQAIVYGPERLSVDAYWYERLVYKVQSSIWVMLWVWLLLFVVCGPFLLLWWLVRVV